jgi:sirohydrochlorin cobaltochelatase
MPSGSPCIVLFAHGARDARWSQTLIDLRQRVAQRRPDADVRLAYLEFQPPALDDVLLEVVAAGCSSIDLVPVFWASGGHVANDLPPLLAAFRARHPQVSLRLLPVLSEMPGLLDLVADVAAGVAAGVAGTVRSPSSSDA